MALSCAVPNHCPQQQVCCARQVQDPQNPLAFHYVTIACEDECKGVFPPALTVCDPSDPDGTCPPGKACSESDFAPAGVFVCK